MGTCLAAASVVAIEQIEMAGHGPAQYPPAALSRRAVRGPEFGHHCIMPV